MSLNPQSSVRGRVDALDVLVAITGDFGWRCAVHGPVTVWAKGYGTGADAGALAKTIARLPVVDAPAICQLLSQQDGHFAIAASGECFAFAAVDWVRSIPLAFARCGDQWCIDDQALRLRNRAGLGPKDIDAEAALSIAMAGYTIDVATLYRGLNQLGPGEFVIFLRNEEPQRHRYYCYRPWRADKPAYNEKRAKTELRDLTLSIIDSMMKGLNGRELVVPLSAGRDSRLIVSAAHHLGYRNVRCFAYGRDGNFEAVASKAIAERLGFKWQFVPTGINFMRRYFDSNEHRSYLEFCDSTQSTPFIQDLPQVRILKNRGFIPSDAVLCNGNSGDYISGAHIVPEMQDAPVGLSREARMQQIIDALIGKHFALWHDLMTAGNRAHIAKALKQSLSRAGASLAEPSDDYGLYEYAEFQDRQCKYVITGQRIYEFLGHEWRLPLWAKPYLDFWESVPLVGKVKQILYAAMLDEENWGGVWQGLPVNAKSIKPGWIRPIRFAAKLAHLPLGRDRWHAFERRYFQYWMSPTGASASVPYWTAIRDRGGSRHGVSWLSRFYLLYHGAGGEPDA